MYSNEPPRKLQKVGLQQVVPEQDVDDGDGGGCCYQQGLVHGQEDSSNGVIQWDA